MFAEPTYEGAVDLDVVHGEALEVGERGVPRAEIVYDRPHTQILKLFERGRSGQGVAHSGALGDLQEEVARLELRLIDYASHGVDQAGPPKLSCREVDAHGERIGESLRVP